MDTLTIELETDRLLIVCRETKGWWLVYNVKYSDTIQKVKQEIFESESLPVKMQPLILNGLELENEKQLQDYKFNSGDTVLLKADYRPIVKELKSFCSILEKMTEDI